MSKLRIQWSPTAVNHFANWIRYIARDSIKSADREREALLKSVERLKRFPSSGRVVPEFGNPTLREIIKKPIRIIYRLTKNEVRLLTFHHSKRQLDLTLFS